MKINLDWAVLVATVAFLFDAITRIIGWVLHEYKKDKQVQESYLKIEAKLSVIERRLNQQSNDLLSITEVLNSMNIYVNEVPEHEDI